MGPLGAGELVFIFVLALLLFGPKKLPELGKTIGKAMTEFRRAQAELKSTFDREMQNIEKETGVKELVATDYKTGSYDYSSYDSSYYDSPVHNSNSDSSVTTTAGASATEGAGSTATALHVEAAAGSIAIGQSHAETASHDAGLAAFAGEQLSPGHSPIPEVPAAEKTTHS